MRFVDISLPLSSRLPTWPGNTAFQLEPVARIAEGAPANVSRLVSGTHSGTHVDAPRHFLDQGRAVDELSLHELIGPCAVVELDAPLGTTISQPALARAAGARPASRLLLKTRNSTLWQRAEFTPDFVSLAPDAAAWLVAQDVRVMGIDYLSIETFGRAGAPAHHALLGAGVIVIEGLDLAAVAPGSYELICLPLRLAGADGAPARVVLGVA